jgi:hypothetical protein
LLILAVPAINGKPYGRLDLGIPAGRIVNFTSQRAGTVAAFAPPPGPAGPASGPAAIIAADVTVAPESFRVLRLSHDCWAKTGEAEINKLTTTANKSVRDTVSLLKLSVRR